MTIIMKKDIPVETMRKGSPVEAAVAAVVHIKPAFSGPNVGKTCRTHYKGTFNDGTQFDSSYDRGQPLEFVCGAGQMIKGFDAAVADMKVGEIKEIHLMPEEAMDSRIRMRSLLLRLNSFRVQRT